MSDDVDLSLDNLKNLNTACYLPWVGLNINAQGRISPCCKYNVSFEKTVDDYYSSQELKELKKQFINGERPSGCERCWRDEDSGIISKRIFDFEKTLGGKIPENDNLKILSFVFGNTCNLTCRTCNSNASSKWLTEEKKLVGKIPVNLSKHETFYKDANFLKSIKNRINENTVQVDISGGEPFLTGIKEHLEFLDFLNTKNSKNIKLHYTTNTTIFPDEDFWSKWKNFREVEFQLSIDNIEKQFEYLRHPANWEDCLKNIEKYKEKRVSNENVTLSISHTVSIFNIFYLPKFIIWCLKNSFGKPYIGLATYPRYYSLTNLNKETKEELIKIPGMPKEIINDIQYSEPNLDLLKNWVDYTKIIDEMRNEKFQETFPEYYELLKKTSPVLF